MQQEQYFHQHHLQYLLFPQFLLGHHQVQLHQKVHLRRHPHLELLVKVHPYPLHHHHRRQPNICLMYQHH
jgi:hypothetical protein